VSRERPAVLCGQGADNNDGVVLTVKIIDQCLPEIDRCLYGKDEMLGVDDIGVQILFQFEPEAFLKSGSAMVETKGFADQNAVSIDDCGLVFVFGGINTDNILAGDPLAFFVKLLLVHEILLSFYRK